MPRVSVVTPCYNSAAFVGKTILSVRHQTFTDWEQIVVDDGSRDASATVVAGYLGDDSRLRLVTQPNVGVAAARNRGFRECDNCSEYLLFLDADDILMPEMLAEMVQYLDAHREVGLLYCDPVFIDAEDRMLDPATFDSGWSPRSVPAGFGVRTLRDDEPETPFLSILGLTTIIPSLAIFRRADYIRTPQWDEGFGHIFEDANLFLHMALVSRVHHLPRQLIQYRRHGNQSTANRDKYYSQELKLLARWRDPQGLTPEQRDVVMRAWNFREGRLLPYQGWVAGTRHLRRGEFVLALRFLGGAARRYLTHLYCSF